MGVNPTPSNYKTFTFDNTNSAQYGVYITGQGVFNAPERNVEMVTIPGRNGSYALDHGNFNNIEVTYPAGIVADTEADFATAVSDLRNFLCSKEGYCRLEDDYNSGEYRMAVYKSGLEVTHEGLLTGEFNITFECKPQRWLTSGETKQTLTSGNAITNPTKFASKPMLEVYGYGDITVGNYGAISVENVPLGNVQIFSASSVGSAKTLDSFPLAILGDLLNTGDTFDVSGVSVDVVYSAISGYYATVVNNSFSNETNCTASRVNTQRVRIEVDDITFTKGTSDTLNYSVQYDVVVGRQGYGGSTKNVTFDATIVYDGDSTLTVTFNTHTNVSPATANKTINVPDIFADSTRSALGNPMYIDLDIGEAYNTDYGTAVSVNNNVTLPAELPTLPSGNTTITFDNTFTQVDIVPRWWRV